MLVLSGLIIKNQNHSIKLDSLCFRDKIVKLFEFLVNFSTRTKHDKKYINENFYF
jgi:hypothetical protein